VPVYPLGPRAFFGAAWATGRALVSARARCF
jgi:hypothetical protein